MASRTRIGWIQVALVAVLALQAGGGAWPASSEVPEVSLPAPETVAAATALPPQGLYESCMFHTPAALAECKAHLDHMAAAGFKLVLNYDSLDAPLANLVAYADHAHRLGMKVIWAMNHPVWWTGDAVATYSDLAWTCGCTTNTSFAQYIVGRLKGHPATWGYYLADEVSTNLAAAKRYWSVVRAADPGHPTLAVSAEDEATLGTAMDPIADAEGITVLAPDVYPIGREFVPERDPLYSVGRSVAHVQDLATANGKQTGAVLQAFNWKKMYPSETWLPVSRFPTANEMRTMRDDAVANGDLQFILWYSYFDLMNDLPWEQHWKDLQWAAFDTTATTTVTPTTTGRYNALTPARILDTRNGTGGIGALGPGATANAQVTGRGGVPTSGVAAVVMNVTAVSPSASGFLTLFPSGSARPLAANLNFVPGAVVPNLVVVGVGGDGKVALYNSAGTTHVIFDVAGWYSTAPAGNDGRYQSLEPARILDTRNGTGGGVRLGPGASLDVQVSGRGGVPASGAAAAVLNVAVTATTATSFLTVYPTGASRPNAANLNFNAATTVSNRVMSKLGTGGKVTVFNNSGSTDVVVDVNGWYTDASVSGTAGAYSSLAPTRILDTRDGTGGISGPRAANSTVDVQVTGRGGIPASGVSAVVLNVPVTQPAAGGFLSLFPAGAARPLASDLNYASGETRPNLVVVKVGTDGKVSLFSSAGTHVIFDVAGWVGA